MYAGEHLPRSKFSHKRASQASCIDFRYSLVTAHYRPVITGGGFPNLALHLILNSKSPTPQPTSSQHLPGSWTSAFPILQYDTGPQIGFLRFQVRCDLIAIRLTSPSLSSLFTSQFLDTKSPSQQLAGDYSSFKLLPTPSMLCLLWIVYTVVTAPIGLVNQIKLIKLRATKPNHYPICQDQRENIVT